MYSRRTNQNCQTKPAVRCSHVSKHHNCNFLLLYGTMLSHVTTFQVGKGGGGEGRKRRGDCRIIKRQVTRVFLLQSWTKCKKITMLGMERLCNSVMLNIFYKDDELGGTQFANLLWQILSLLIWTAGAHKYTYNCSARHFSISRLMRL